MPPRLFFHPAAVTDIPLLRDLAERVWRTSYAAMLSPAQIDYMLARMYAPVTIAAEMERGVRWTVATLDGQAIGYLSLSLPLERQDPTFAQPHAEGSHRAELHKLYLIPEHQGAGLGQRMLVHARDAATAAGAAELRLRVNKTNARALKSYERAGFRVVDALVADIGGGFVMDDYVLSLPLHPGPLVKICGLSTPETLEAALAAGADQIGLVFFPKSPRHVPLDRARDLAARARGRAAIVALTVDADDAALDAIAGEVAPDWLQLHGRETPGRVEAVKRRADRPVMKALGLSDFADLAMADGYRGIADRLLFDAKPPKGAALPGGNGVPFDWTILRDVEIPYMLSGGLTPDTVAEALRISGASAVDVSSGVETAPGQKDPRLIAVFVAAARQAGAARRAGLAAPRGLSQPLGPGDQS